MAQALEIVSDKTHSSVLRHASTLIKILNDLNIESSFSSDTVALSNFIISELSLYNTHLVDDGVDIEIVNQASYFVSSAFDDIFTRKKLYSGAASNGFLLRTQNEPGALSRFWEMTDEISKGVNEQTVDLAILAMSLIEIGYLGKYENLPDRFTLIRVQSEALELAIEEWFIIQKPSREYRVSNQSYTARPLWSILSIILLVSIGLYYVTEQLISKKYADMGTIVAKMEQIKN